MRNARIAMGLMICTAAAAGLWQPPTWFNINNWGLETLSEEDSVFGTVSISATGRMARLLLMSPSYESDWSLTPYPQIFLSGQFNRFGFSLSGEEILNAGGWYWEDNIYLERMKMRVTVFDLSARLNWIFFDRLMLWAGYDHHLGIYDYLMGDLADTLYMKVDAFGHAPSFSSGFALRLGEKIGLECDVQGPSFLDMTGTLQFLESVDAKISMAVPLTIRANAIIEAGSGLHFYLGTDYSFTSTMDSIYFEIPDEYGFRTYPLCDSNIVSVAVGAGYKFFDDLTFHLWGNYTSPVGTEYTFLINTHAITLAGGLSWEPGPWELRLVLGIEDYQLQIPGTWTEHYTGQGLLTSFGVSRSF